MVADFRDSAFIRWCNPSVKSDNVTAINFADAVQEPSARLEDMGLACEHWIQPIPEAFGTPSETFEGAEEVVEVAREFFSG
jgi:hypothetical protein